MNRSMKSLGVSVVLVAGMTMGASALAQQHGMTGMGRADCSQGRGMMGGGMMGGGMMGGGMMGGGMMGNSRMGQMLGLTDGQKAKIRKIRRSLRKKVWSLMGKMMDEKDTLRDLYAKERKDAKAIGRVYDRIFAIKRQIIVAKIQARNRKMDVLTAKQRAQLKRMRSMMRRGGMGMRRGEGRKGRSGHMPGMMGK